MANKQIGLKKINSSFENIFSRDEFKALITYERTRSDRNGSIFSIIILDTSSKQLKDLKKIINKTKHIARSIDCIGWYDNDNIAILLPDTENKGAIIFGNKLVSELFNCARRINIDGFKITTKTEKGGVRCWRVQ